MNAPTIAVSEPEFVAWVHRGVDDSTFASEFPSVDFDQVSDLFDTDIGRQAMWELFPRKRTDPGGLAAAVANMDRVVRENSRQASLVALRPTLRLAGAAGRWVISTRAIPPNKVAAIEDAVRLVNRTRSTSDATAWWKRSGKHIRLLAEALNWPERAAARTGRGGGTFRVEPFLVHDTLSLNRAARDEITANLEKAVAAIRSKGAPYTKVLYGDVHIVGQLRRASVAAWYENKYDALYVRPALHSDHDVVQTICHELGHRAWYRDLSDAQRTAWEKYYDKLYHVKLPAAGESIPFLGAMLTVRFYSGSKASVILEEQTDQGRARTYGSMDKRKLLEQIRYRAFPTPYASTDVKELFAESFGNYMVDELKGGNLETFLRLTSEQT